MPRAPVGELVTLALVLLLCVPQESPQGRIIRVVNREVRADAGGAVSVLEEFLAEPLERAHEVFNFDFLLVGDHVEQLVELLPAGLVIVDERREVVFQSLLRLRADDGLLPEA